MANQKVARDDWRARFLQMRRYCREANAGARLASMTCKQLADSYWKVSRDRDEYRSKWIHVDTEINVLREKYRLATTAIKDRDKLECNNEQLRALLREIREFVMTMCVEAHVEPPLLMRRVDAALGEE